MNFRDAIQALKNGSKVCRAGWNGKGMGLVLQPATPNCQLSEGTVYKKAGLEQVTINAHIDMFTAVGEMQPGWLASQTDILAEAWEIVP